MKRSLYAVILAASIIFTGTACKKNYHCACTFNNVIQQNTDLGNQTKKDAKNLCSQMDSTVVGEVWNCNAY